ncbi:DUF6357 family protein [Streptomyces sp. NPDC004783]|uniref:DUF6357 family protein n=1 Tax=Streptomyces sp. NPDC004783 TaxID=3154459 RepID=UPI0033AC7133
MRPLIFSDDKDHEREWVPGDPRTAEEAFLEFVEQHRDVDNASCGIEDEENEEALLLLFGAGVICRTKGTRNSSAEYRFVTNDGDHWSRHRRGVDPHESPYRR